MRQRPSSHCPKSGIFPKLRHREFLRRALFSVKSTWVLGCSITIGAVMERMRFGTPPRLMVTRFRRTILNNASPAEYETSKEHT